MEGFLTWTDETLLRFILDTEAERTIFETRSFEQMSNKKDHPVKCPMDKQGEEAVKNIQWTGKR